MNNIHSIGHKTRHIFILSVLLLSLTAQAQRLELRFDKEFSNNAMVNKSLGGGASLIIDSWSEHLDFQFNFDYDTYKTGDDNVGTSTQFNKLKGGISALYVLPIGKRFFFRVGGDVSYNNLKKVDQWQDTTQTNLDNGKSTILCTHRGHYLGLAGVAQFQVKVGNFLRIGAGITPTYLIPLANKTSLPNVESDYKKGMFVLQLQVGIEIKLSNN